jgi:hypothetical protein
LEHIGTYWKINWKIRFHVVPSFHHVPSTPSKRHCCHPTWGEPSEKCLTPVHSSQNIDVKAAFGERTKTLGEFKLIHIDLAASCLLLVHDVTVCCCMMLIDAACYCHMSDCENPRFTERTSTNLGRSHRLPHVCTIIIYGKFGGYRLQETAAFIYTYICDELWIICDIWVSLMWILEKYNDITLKRGLANLGRSHRLPRVFF